MDAMVEGDEVGNLEAWEASLFAARLARFAAAAKAAELSCAARARGRLRQPVPARGRAVPAPPWSSAGLIIGIADVAGLDQHRRSFGPAQHMEGGELVRPGPKLDPAGGPAQQPLGKPGRSLHLLAQGDIGQQRADTDRRLRSTSASVRPIFRLGEARRLRARSDVGQRIDGCALGQRIGRAVHVQRQEQAGLQPPGNRRPAAPA